MRQVNIAVDSCRMGAALRWHGDARRCGSCWMGVSESVWCCGTHGARPCGVSTARQGNEPPRSEPKALEAMELFDLAYAADRRFCDLSGGEAQRLMLSRAVCSRPNMLLVDEPTAQLDTRTSHSVSHVLGNLAGQGMIVLVATHDPDTRDACDRVIDLADYAPQVAGLLPSPPTSQSTNRFPQSQRITDKTSITLPLSETARSNPTKCHQACCLA